MSRSIFESIFGRPASIRSVTSWGSSYRDPWAPASEPIPAPKPTPPAIKVKPKKPRPVAEWYLRNEDSGVLTFAHTKSTSTKKVSERDYNRALEVTMPSHGRVILVDDVLKTIDARNAAIEKVTVRNEWGKNRKSSIKGRARICQAYWHNGHMVRSR